MTMHELSQLNYLNCEISEYKQKLAQLESMASGNGTHFTGLPHINSISNKTAIACDISDIKATIEEKAKQSIMQYKYINDYISSLDDCLIRQIITLRFVNGLKWRDVAQRIGGNNTESSVQVMLRRYLIRQHNV